MLYVVFGYVGYLVQIARTKLKPEFPITENIVKKISGTRYFAKELNKTLLIEECLEFWVKVGLFTSGEGANHKIGFRHQAFQFYGAAIGLSLLTKKRRKIILNKISNNPQWFDVLQLYLGMKPISDLDLD